MTDKDRGVYTPPPDEYERFDVSEDDDSRRGPLLLVVAVAVLIALIAVVYTAYNQGVRSGGRKDAPLIAAPAGPIKSTANPAEQQTPSKTESAAYEAMDNSGDDREVVTAPAPEQPADRQQQVEATSEPIVTQPTPKPAMQPAPKPIQTYQFQTDGKYVVQLGAFRSEEQALATWTKIRKRLSLVMDGATPDVQKADLGEKGVYYRLRAAAFASRAHAIAFCDSLKAKGQDCLVVAR